MSVVEHLAGLGVLPVVVIDDAAETADVARPLRDGGVDCAEVTLRTTAGIAAIEAGSAEGLLVGAGTVLDRRRLEAAVGARALRREPSLEDRASPWRARAAAMLVKELHPRGRINVS